MSNQIAAGHRPPPLQDCMQRTPGLYVASFSSVWHLNDIEDRRTHPAFELVVLLVVFISAELLVVLLLLVHRWCLRRHVITRGGADLQQLKRTQRWITGGRDAETVFLQRLAFVPQSLKPATLRD